MSHHITRLFCHQLARFYSYSTPIVVLGHQKSGTSIVAYLLGKALQCDAANDMMFRAPGSLTSGNKHLLTKVLDGRVSFDQIAVRNPSFFLTPVFKDPDFSLMISELLRLFPRGKFVFVVRDPRSNIRSILDRVDLPGDHISMRREHIPEVWRLIIDGKLPDVPGSDYIEKLAHRWNIFVRQAICFKSLVYILRYEDFCERKIESIEGVLESFSIAQKTSIDEYVDEQRQSKGLHRGKELSFFGNENLGRIQDICGELMREFDYPATWKDPD